MLSTSPRQYHVFMSFGTWSWTHVINQPQTVPCFYVLWHVIMDTRDQPAQESTMLLCPLARDHGHTWSTSPRKYHVFMSFGTCMCVILLTHMNDNTYTHARTHVRAQTHASSQQAEESIIFLFVVLYVYAHIHVIHVLTCTHIHINAHRCARSACKLSTSVRKLRRTKWRQMKRATQRRAPDWRRNWLSWSLSSKNSSSMHDTFFCFENAFLGHLCMLGSYEAGFWVENLWKWFFLWCCAWKLESESDWKALWWYSVCVGGSHRSIRTWCPGLVRPTCGTLVWR